MRALTWRTVAAPADPAIDCTVFAARLSLRSRRALALGVLHAVRIRGHLRRSTDPVGYALAVDLASRTLWTVTAWSDRAALARFERSPAHRAAKNLLRERLASSTFAVWRCHCAGPLVEWAEIHNRIALAELR